MMLRRVCAVVALVILATTVMLSMRHPPPLPAADRAVFFNDTDASSPPEQISGTLPTLPAVPPAAALFFADGEALPSRVSNVPLLDSVPSVGAEHSGVGHQSWRRVVFAILSDPPFVDARLRPMLRTWLTDTHRTHLFFTKNASTRMSVADVLGQDASPRSDVSLEYIAPPPSLAAHPNAAWKNYPIARFLAATYASGNSSTDPEWFVTIDDDTYLLAAAVAHHLHRIAAASPPAAPLYAGHHVLACALCRTKAKRFPFAFGGSGIFLNHAALHILNSRLDRCAPRYTVGAGDERVGACFRDAGVPLIAVDGGCESVLTALGEGRSLFLTTSAFPYAFHRIKTPAAALSLYDAERLAGERSSELMVVLSWARIASHFLDPSPSQPGALCGPPSPLWTVFNATPWRVAGRGGAGCLPLPATMVTLFPTENDPAARAARDYWNERKARARRR